MTKPFQATEHEYSNDEQPASKSQAPLIGGPIISAPLDGCSMGEMNRQVSGAFQKSALRDRKSMKLHCNGDDTQELPLKYL